MYLGLCKFFALGDPKSWKNPGIFSIISSVWVYGEIMSGETRKMDVLRVLGMNFCV